MINNAEPYFDLKPEIRQKLCDTLKSFGFEEFNLLVWNSKGWSHVTTNLNVKSPEDISDLFELELLLAELAGRLASMFQMVTEEAEYIHKKIGTVGWTKKIKD